MASVQQLVAAAFIFCGFLFLLHIDSVNSLRCKDCFDDNPDCDSGNVPDIECHPNAKHCLLRIINSSMLSAVQTVRSCTADANGISYCVELSPTRTVCNIYCCTDNCN